MFSISDKAILEFVVQMIDEAEKVVIRHNGVYKALNDFEGKNAILLNIIQIGEKLNKIKSEELKSILPIKEAYSIRNRITHDYDGINLIIVEQIVAEELPLLKNTIINILKKYTN